MYEELFRWAAFATPVWLLLILLPRWRVTRWFASTMAAPLYIGVLYLAGVAWYVGEYGIGFMSDFGSVEGVLRLLSNPSVAIVAWLHILAFDHVVGILIYRENMERGFVSMPVQSGILFLTLMLGPVGFVSYWLIRMQRLREAAYPIPAAADTRAAESAQVVPTQGLQTWRTLTALIRRRLSQERLLTGYGLAGLAIAAVLLVIHAIRGGAPIPPEGDLTKAITFTAGVGIYLLTLAFWLPAAGLRREGRRNWLAVMAVSTTYAYAIESVQVLRGLDPRFSRVAGPVDQAAGGLFFLAACVIIALFLVLAWRIFRPDRSDGRGALLLAMRYAAFAVMFGFVAGLWMSAVNGRFVGDGGNLIPLHALGFHGLQAIPAVALLLAWAGAFPGSTRLTVHLAGGGWLLACAGMAWQAAAGQVPSAAGLPLLLSIAGLLVWASCFAIAMMRWTRAGRHVPIPGTISAVPSLADTQARPAFTPPAQR